MKSADKLGMLYQLLNAPVCPYPYPHCYIEDVFNPNCYERLLNHFPAEDFFSNKSIQTTLYPTERYNLPLTKETLNQLSDDSREVWSNLSSWMNSQEFLLGLFNKFRDPIIQRTKQEKHSLPTNDLNLSPSILMAMDKTKYNLGPHTDVARKLVTLILYFAEDDSKKHLGTSIYIPKKRDFHMLNSPHLNYKDFDLVKTLEYKPNSAFMFVVSSNSFHGVEPINEVIPKRQLIQYQIVH